MVFEEEVWVVMNNGGAVRGDSAGAKPTGWAVLDGVRCLVVEDFALVSEKLEQLLRRAGATTEAASTVDAACSALAEREFDLVLLDLNLRGQNGIGVARAAYRLPSAPVVFVLTGELDFIDLEELERLGAKVMMKVNVGRELPGMLGAVLDERRARTLPPRSSSISGVMGSVRKVRGAAEFSSRERTFLERLESGEILSVDTVAREILGRGSDNHGNEIAVRKFVSRLRAKLDERSAELGCGCVVIETVYGGAYRCAPGMTESDRKRG